MKSIVLSVIAIVLLSSFCFAQEEVVFRGTPVVRITEGGTTRVAEDLKGSDATEYQCIITRVEDSYYWTTREDVEMVPIVSGAFTTYVAVNGSGYVRTLNPELKVLASHMSETEQTFDYVEHLLLGLRTISYYGKAD